MPGWGMPGMGMPGPTARTEIRRKRTKSKDISSSGQRLQRDFKCEWARLTALTHLGSRAGPCLGGACRACRERRRDLQLCPKKGYRRNT